MAKKIGSGKEIVYWIVSEVATYFAVLYALLLLQASTTSIWLSALLLFVLINIAILFCPVIKKCYKS